MKTLRKRRRNIWVWFFESLSAWWNKFLKITVYRSSLESTVTFRDGFLKMGRSSLPGFLRGAWTWTVWRLKYKGVLGRREWSSALVSWCLLHGVKLTWGCGGPAQNTAQGRWNLPCLPVLFCCCWMTEFWRNSALGVVLTCFGVVPLETNEMGKSNWNVRRSWLVWVSLFQMMQLCIAVLLLYLVNQAICSPHGGSLRNLSAFFNASFQPENIWSLRSLFSLELPKF